MSKLRTLVVGVGHLGRIHARLMSQTPELELVAVVDPNTDGRLDVAEELGVPGFASVAEVPFPCDAAVIVTPTSYHHQVAAELLQQGVHLLVEKPIAKNAEEANHLVALAEAHDCVLQIGHIERFNPAFQAVAGRIRNPKYIQASRCSGFTLRSTDIGVVLDLMIHDIDLCLSLCQSDVVDVEAMGVTYFGPHEDWAVARLLLANGCVANLQASRASHLPMRQFSVQSPEGYATLDLGAGQATWIEASDPIRNGELNVHSLSADQKQTLRDSLFESYLVKHPLDVEPVNAIVEEQRDFARAIQRQQSPQVTGRDGRDALHVAERILQRIETHAWTGSPRGPMGPQAFFQSSHSPGLRRAG